MMPPKDDLSLRRIDPLATESVPKAGHHELARCQRERETRKDSFILFLSLTILTAIGALLTPAGPLISGYLAGAAAVFGLSSAIMFGRLAMSRGDWQALPEGASEATALLEDALTKSIRALNVDITAWNDGQAALDAEILLWRSKLEDPARREDGWSEISHGMEGEALFTRGKNLMIERRNLCVRRRKIHQAISRLNDALRRSDQESQAPDPEPEDG